MEIESRIDLVCVLFCIIKILFNFSLFLKFLTVNWSPVSLFSNRNVENWDSVRLELQFWYFFGVLDGERRIVSFQLQVPMLGQIGEMQQFAIVKMFWWNSVWANSTSSLSNYLALFPLFYLDCKNELYFVYTGLQIGVRYVLCTWIVLVQNSCSFWFGLMQGFDFCFLWCSQCSTPFYWKLCFKLLLTMSCFVYIN